ncbi:hypothetical protein OTU49_005959 [Cherax quadricarinatus]|uniref:Heparan sulfate-N-deacetylase N-terminal domain-containing protein n=1 Tax=Cherax quadricarinatus TaxID=27406 RepID=A0AAW0X5Q4_CHEQU
MHENMESEQSLLVPSAVDSYAWGESNWEGPHPSHSTSQSSRNLPLICRPWRLWHRATLCFAGSRKASWRRYILGAAIVIIVVVIYSVSESSHRSLMSLVRGRPPESLFRCNNLANASLPRLRVPPKTIENRLREDPKVLLFTETRYSKTGKDITNILVANRIKYKMEVLGKSLPGLTNLSRGKYGTIIFENFERYLQIDPWNRELLDKYMRDYNVGMIGFMPSHEDTQVGAKLRGFPLYVHTNMALENISLNSENPVLQLTRAGGTITDNVPGSEWTVFSLDDPTYVPLEWGYSSVPHFSEEKLVSIILLGVLVAPAAVP